MGNHIYAGQDDLYKKELFGNTDSGKMKIGFNIDGLNDWNNQIIFKDIMKMSRPFRIVAADRPAGFWNGFNTRQIPISWYDDNGYPLKVPYVPPGWNLSVRPMTYLITSVDNSYPKGLYTLRFNGKGKLALTGDSGSHLIDGFGGTTEYKFEVAAKFHMNITLDIMSSEPGDHIRNIQVILPGFGNDDIIEQPFYPPFIERLKGSSVLRFFGDDSYVYFDEFEPKPVVSWRQRKPASYRTQSKVGVGDWQGCGLALEYMIKMCNEVSADLWLCTGCQWNDGYIAKAAELIKNNLNQGLRVWIEYSDETWNKTYRQNAFAKTAALKKSCKITDKADEHWWTVYRSARIWKIFAEVFGGYNRIVKVIGGCTEDFDMSEKRIAHFSDKDCNPDNIYPDAIGLSLYMKAGNVSSSDSAASIHQRCRSEILSLDTELDKFVDLAEKTGTEIVGYIGGLSISSGDTGGFENTKSIVKEPGMYDIYMDFLKMLNDHNIRLINHPFVGNWSFYGLWGALEYIGEDILKAPRYKALMDYINK